MNTVKYMEKLNLKLRLRRMILMTDEFTTDPVDLKPSTMKCTCITTAYEHPKRCNVHSRMPEFQSGGVIPSSSHFLLQTNHNITKPYFGSGYNKNGRIRHLYHKISGKIMPFSCKYCNFRNILLKTVPHLLMSEPSPSKDTDTIDRT